MKKTLVVLVLLSATVAFGQFTRGGYIGGEPSFFEPATHPAHASYTPLAQEQNILANTSYPSAQGDRPPSDFPQPPQRSLGDIARELKKQHALVKKASVVWEN